MKRTGYGRFYLFGSALLITLLLAGCGEGSDDNSRANAPKQPPGEGNPVVFKQGNLPALHKKQVVDTSGQYSAEIRRTTGGVPHIKADNLEEAAFGEGYAQAKDNVCIIADEILKARSQRAKFLGPGPGNINVITDFSFKALGILSKAKKRYPELSSATKAIARGFAAGYNKYLAETGSSDLPKRCAGQPWVRPITPQQLYAYNRIIALFASGDQFVTGVTFEAAPPGVDPQPTQVTGSARAQKRLAKSAYHPFYRDVSDLPMASNGWGIGKNLTQSGRGALLANPHFPYTGSRRFYQSQITVPGVMNINGGSLIGFPLPQIAFNSDIAWTHTVTTANHFTGYKLHLKAGDPLTYVKDGQSKPITSKTFRIQVKTDGPNPKTLKKTFYYSEYGPMISLNTINSALPEWGDKPDGYPVAYTYRDANAKTGVKGIDQYLGMDRSTNLSQFKSIFADCGTVFWVNTMYTDKQGNAYYVDGSSVPNLSQKAIAAFQQRLANDPIQKLLFQRGLVMLDGSTSRDDWVEGKCNGRVPFSKAPQLRRNDFVQNSNDSYWATNPKNLLTGYSPLYGPVENQLSRRTRLGLTMLTRPSDSGLSDVKPAGNDGKFSAKDLITMLYSDRAFMAETLLPDLRKRCDLIASKEVDVANGDSRTVSKGCQALADWNGVFDLDSAGAGTFRVFMGHYTQDLPEDFKDKFDPARPIMTPDNPKPANRDDLAHDPMLQALAQGLNDLDSADIAYDARLGDVQYEHTSGGAPPGGTAHFTDAKIPWHGGQGALEGAFNVVGPITSDIATDTRYPLKVPQNTIPHTGDLSAKPGQGWVDARGTSWHFGLEFKDSGPVAYGLMSYAQSTDPNSPHYNDQDRRYSRENYRRFEFTKNQIDGDPNLKTVTVTAKKH